MKSYLLVDILSLASWRASTDKDAFNCEIFVCVRVLVVSIFSEDSMIHDKSYIELVEICSFLPDFNVLLS